MPHDTDFHKAAHKGDIQTVRDLLSGGEVDVNVRGAADRTALHRAAGAAHVEIVRVLLQLGAAVDCRDKVQRTPLHWAAISGHHATAEVLLEHGADPTLVTSSGMTPLHAAAAMGSLSVSQLLLEWAEPRGPMVTYGLETAKDMEGKRPCDCAAVRKDDVGKQLAKLLKPPSKPPVAKVNGSRNQPLHTQGVSADAEGKNAGGATDETRTPSGTHSSSPSRLCRWRKRTSDHNTSHEKSWLRTLFKFLPSWFCGGRDDAIDSHGSPEQSATGIEEGAASKAAQAQVPPVDVRVTEDQPRPVAATAGSV